MDEEKRLDCREILSEPLGPGEVRLIRNDSLFEQERNIQYSRDGMISSWSMANPCQHPLGPYGWIADTLLSGFSGLRMGQDLLIYRHTPVAGDTDWHWG